MTTNKVTPIQYNWEFLESRNQSLEGVHYSRWSGRLVTGIEGTVAHWLHKIMKCLGLYLLFGDYERNAKQRCVTQALAYGAQLQHRTQEKKSSEEPSPIPPDNNKHKFQNSKALEEYLDHDLSLKDLPESEFVDLLQTNEDLFVATPILSKIPLLEKALNAYGIEAAKAVIKSCWNDKNKRYGYSHYVILHHLHSSVDGFPGTLPHETTKPLVDFLLQEGEDINVRCGRFRLSPLSYAIMFCEEKNSRKDKIIYLIDKGANINLRCPDDNSTPLHWAMQRGLPDVCQILINRGADIDAKDDKDRRVDDYVTQEDAAKMEGILSHLSDIREGKNIKG